MTEITITIDDSGLPRRSDSYLALAWHASQANPAPHADKDAGQFAEHIAREIIRRWLRSVEPELWKHQGRDHYWNELCRFAKHNGSEWVAKTVDDGKDVVHWAIHGESLPAVCKRPTGKRTTWGKDITCTECAAAAEPKDGGAR